MCFDWNSPCFPEIKYRPECGPRRIQLAYLLPVATVSSGGTQAGNLLVFENSPGNPSPRRGLLIGGYIIVFVHMAAIRPWHQHPGRYADGHFQFTRIPRLVSVCWNYSRTARRRDFLPRFLFQGLRQKMDGSKLPSQFGHLRRESLDPASLIPTFVLGFTFAYIYSRTNSVVGRYVLHFTVNAFVCALHWP